LHHLSAAVLALVYLVDLAGLTSPWWTSITLPLWVALALLLAAVTLVAHVSALPIYLDTGRFIEARKARASSKKP
jgi:hypothetical protein